MQAYNFLSLENTPVETKALIVKNEIGEWVIDGYLLATQHPGVGFQESNCDGRNQSINRCWSWIFLQEMDRAYDSTVTRSP